MLLNLLNLLINQFLVGWFYHAPPRSNERTEPVGAPPLSQIPGLSNLSHLPPEEKKQMWFKDSDTAYIQLAKQGGRRGLLCMRTPEPPSDKPVGYPRADWYYDNNDAINQNNNQLNR